MKNILITGVAGMIGSTLLEKLLKKKNLNIIGLDNFTLGKKKYIKSFLKFKNFKFFNLDVSKKLRNIELIKALKKNKLSEIWLLAANSDIAAGVKNSDVDFKNTFLTTYNILNECDKFINKETKILFASSSAIYGTVKNVISENTAPLKPESNYGSMKAACESFISSYSNKNSLKSFIFRFPNVVGTNLTHGVIYDLSKKILTNKKHLDVLGNGHQCKPYSDVSEIINCMIFLKEKKNNQLINFYNIGSNDKGIKVKKIVELLIKKFRYNKKVKYQKQKFGWPGDILTYKYSTLKMKKAGFEFKLSSKEAIEKTINSISKNLLK